MRSLSVIRLAMSAILAAAATVTAVDAQAPTGSTTSAPQAQSSPPARAVRTPEQIAAARAAMLLDWPAMARYREDNATLPTPSKGKPRVVFLGDSITQNWARGRPEFFAGNAYVGRGISGQTSPQMVLRFHQDVIALKPAVVLILAGTNDVAENTGPITDEQVIDNLSAMVEMARAHGIKVVIGSVPPATYFYWNPSIAPTAHIAALNDKIKSWAASQKLTYADFWTAMAMSDGTMNPAYAEDSVHPNPAGYSVMEPIAMAAVERALRTRAK